MFKKSFLIVAAAMVLLLPGCGKSSGEPAAAEPTAAADTAAAEQSVPQPEPSEPTAPEAGLAVAIYLPNDNADGFEISQAEISELSAEAVLGALIDQGVFPAEAAVNSFELSDNEIKIDMNQAFMQAFFGTGTAGEYMKMGSFVNTFLDAFGAQSLSLTVDGSPLETGHSIYDFSMGHMD